MPRRLSGVLVVGLTGVLVLTSFYLFVLGTNSDQVSAMLDQQNTAGIRLWSNLTYYDQHHNDLSLPPGLRDDLVEFSRTTAKVYKISHRLDLFSVFQDESWSDILQRLNKGSVKPFPSGEGTSLDGKSPLLFGHVVVPSDIEQANNNKDPNKNAFVTEGLYQIKFYQEIRDSAQDRSMRDKSLILAISMYILPCLYALLGAFLYMYRPRSNGEHRPEHRYSMAFMLGAIISAFSSLFNTGLTLPLSAIAFLAGYSVDAFISQLDALVERIGRQTSKR
jgi:hypothetical protein